MFNHDSQTPLDATNWRPYHANPLNMAPTLTVSLLVCTTAPGSSFSLQCLTEHKLTINGEATDRPKTFTHYDDPPECLFTIQRLNEYHFVSA